MGQHREVYTNRALRPLLLVACLSAACDGKETTVDFADGIGEGESTLLERDATRAPYWHEDNRRRRDPLVDEWQEEVLHERAKPVLSSLLERLLGDEDPQELLSAEFRGSTALRPSELASVFDDGTTVVRRGSIGPERHGAAHLLELASPLRRLLSAGEPHAHAKIVQVTRSENGGGRGFATRVLVHADGHGAEGDAQMNADWKLEWVLDGDTVRLHALEAGFYEEIVTQEPLFRDMSALAFGDLPRLREEILSGVPEYDLRTDFFMVGGDFPGMHGFGLGDLNGDGRDDIYLAQPSGLTNRLLLGRADGSMEDVTGSTELGFLDGTRSALIVDLDNDGDQDLVISIGAALVVAFNDGKARFPKLVSLRAPDVQEIYSMCAADADGDGDLDLFTCRYSSNDSLSSVPTPYHDANNGAPNVYWRNEGGQRFVDATEEVGLDENNHKYSYAGIWEDFDDDGDLDLYVANDFGLNNLYRNEDGHFRDVAREVGAEDKSSGMGVSVADYDLDGDMDLYITNMFSSAGSRVSRQPDRYMEGKQQEVHGEHYRFARGNTLLSNRGDGTFEDVTDEARVAVGGWAWGAKFVDFNNDGRSDIYSPNGYITNDDPDDT